MTESEWLACTTPKPMVRFLLGTNQPRVQDIESFPNCKASDRKLRLFACACYARLRYLLPNPLARDAVAVAERFAEGEAEADELQRADSLLQAALDPLEGPWRASRGAQRAALLPTHEALALALQVTRSEAPKAACYASSNAYLAAAAIAHPGAATTDLRFSASQAAEERAQAGLLRCLFGPLLFRPVPLVQSWLSWNDGCIVKMANRIYEERAFDRLPVLADALEEAGCGNADILAHCRRPGPHVRGCWLLDLILAKEPAPSGESVAGPGTGASGGGQVAETPGLVRFCPSRAEGLPDVREVVVRPDRLEVNTAGRWVTFSFRRIGRRQEPRVVSLVKRLVRRAPWRLAVADRDWFHAPPDRFFLWYTDPPPRTCMPVDEPFDHATCYFWRIQVVLGSGGYATLDLG
jgi:hypothetical protein